MQIQTFWVTSGRWLLCAQSTLRIVLSGHAYAARNSLSSRHFLGLRPSVQHSSCDTEATARIVSYVIRFYRPFFVNWRNLAWVLKNSFRGISRTKFARKLSYKRGCQEKNSLPPLRGGMDVVACIQHRLRLGEVLFLGVLSSPRIPARPTQLMVPTRWFHDAMVLDAFGSGSYASICVGESANHDPM
jgi:hypothetical protein